MSLWLAQEELEVLTGYKTWNRMCLELGRQGVPFTRRRDGFPLVLRSHFTAQIVASKVKKPKPLNYGAL